jgi:UMF1 family MFS transporter
MGYIGSVVLLVAVLAVLLSAPEAKQMQVMQWSFVSVGVWWVVFSQYTYYFLPTGVKQKTRLHLRYY